MFAQVMDDATFHVSVKQQIVDDKYNNRVAKNGFGGMRGMP